MNLHNLHNSFRGNWGLKFDENQIEQTGMIAHFQNWRVDYTQLSGKGLMGKKSLLWLSKVEQWQCIYICIYLMGGYCTIIRINAVTKTYPYHRVTKFNNQNHP